MFQCTHLSCDDWRNICILSYYHHQIGSMNYYPLFRVRSWNNVPAVCLSIFLQGTSVPRNVLSVSRIPIGLYRHSLQIPSNWMSGSIQHVLNLSIPRYRIIRQVIYKYKDKPYYRCLPQTIMGTKWIPLINNSSVPAIPKLKHTKIQKKGLKPNQII